MDEGQRNLESCLNEFFDPRTSNERKRQIESLLENFSKQKGSWKRALEFLIAPGANQYVVMFSLNVLEKAIKMQWLSTTERERDDLRISLHKILIEVKIFPSIARNKIIKLLSDIGRYTWPHSDVEFFSRIYEMSSRNDTINYGLIFLKTISEEWPNAKDDIISTERKFDLKNLLIHEIPRIFDLLYNILLTAFNQRISLSNNTPNSSPNSENTPPIHDRLDEIICLSMNSGAHYLSWVPLKVENNFYNNKGQKTPLTLEFIHLICKYSLFDSFSDDLCNNTLSSTALSVLNELLYRKFFPNEFDNHMNFIVKFAIELLNKINNTSISCQKLSNEYIDKVIEFLCLVSSGHFHRYDESAAKAFLSLLLPFTFNKQIDSKLYYDCLEIWSRLLDHLIANLAQNRQIYIENFKHPILGLANGIIQSTLKFQQLAEETFDNTDDDDVESPTLIRNADILIKIGEILPTELLNIVTINWEESCTYYASLQKHLDSSNKTLNYDNIIKIEHFNFIVQFGGRVANIFYGDVFKEEMALGKSLFQQLVSVAILSKSFYFVKSPKIIIQANCEIIYSLGSWIFWLSRFYSEVILSDSTMGEQQNFFEILGLLLELVFFTLEHRASIDPSILLAMSHFFATFVNSIRAQYLFQMAGNLQNLFEKIYLLKNSIDSDLLRVEYRQLNKAVASLLLLGWHSVQEQEWDHRTQLYNLYMRPIISQELLNASGNADDLLLNLDLINDQLELLRVENSTPKKIVWENLKELVPFLQRLASSYLRRPRVIGEILKLFINIMEVLRTSTGAEFFEESIRGFMNLFQTENIINDLLRETESSSIVLEKFLEMLQFMVKEPSPSFKKFLPDSLAFCFDNIYPIISQRSSPDISAAVFSLIRDILIYRWNFFYPPLVLKSSSSNNQSQQIAEKRFDQILNSIGHSFLQDDIQVFRFNLYTLSIINEKHRLFTKLPNNILSQFITVLLQILVHKNQDLNREEVGKVIWEIVIDFNFNKFRQEFLPNFLISNFAILSTEQRMNLLEKFGSNSQQQYSGMNMNDEFCEGNNENEIASANNNNNQITDLPTFIQSLEKFIENIRYYHYVVECSKFALPENIQENATISSGKQNYEEELYN